MSNVRIVFFGLPAIGGFGFGLVSLPVAGTVALSAAALVGLGYALGRR